jgi:hypothetical protein
MNPHAIAFAHLWLGAALQAWRQGWTVRRRSDGAGGIAYPVRPCVAPAQRPTPKAADPCPCCRRDAPGTRVAHWAAAAPLSHVRDLP